MNNVILIGHIGNDPEQFKFENGNIKTSFSLATSESYKDKSGEWQEQTEWHRIVLFKESKLQKGDLISLVGKIKTREYESNGEKKYITEIIGLKAGLLSRKGKYSPDEIEQMESTELSKKIESEMNDDLPF